jgi:hypothetical protein
MGSLRFNDPRVHVFFAKCWKWWTISTVLLLIHFIRDKKIVYSCFPVLNRDLLYGVNKSRLFKCNGVEHSVLEHFVLISLSMFMHFQNKSFTFTNRRWLWPFIYIYTLCAHIRTRKTTFTWHCHILLEIITVCVWQENCLFMFSRLKQRFAIWCK